MAKHYLTGLDWMIHALNSATHRSCPTGNSSQIVLELDGRIDVARLEEALQEITTAFPLINGRPARGWTLEPFWKSPSKKGTLTPPRIEVIKLHGDDGALAALQRCANTPFRSEREHLIFYLLDAPSGSSHLAMAFDHRLFDARGAEQFLQCLNLYIDGDLPLTDMQQAATPIRPSLLNHWGRRFRGGRALMRELRRVGDGEISRFAFDSNSGGESTFLHFPLTAEETAAYHERADRDAGFMMQMPYSMLVAATVYDRICKAAGLPESSFMIPCSTDMRGNASPFRTLFFNYCSMLFFRLEPSMLKDRAEGLAALKSQFYNQCKAKFPQSFEDAAVLMRILPARLFDRLLCKYMSHSFGSFSFAYVGDSAFKSDHFSGAKVTNLHHMPHIPPLVGIGFFFSQYRNKLNIGVSFRAERLPREAEQTLTSTLTEICGNTPGSGIDRGVASGTPYVN